ncbi:MAG: DUF3810 domain-containing protein [Bacteroidota bacterium]
MTQNDMTPRLKVTFSRWWPLLLASIVLVFRLLAGPVTIERYYSRGLFPLLRVGWDNTIARLPIPLFYVFWLLILGGVIWLSRRFLTERRKNEPAWGKLGRRLVNFIALLFSAFLLGWGFNYGRQSVETTMGFMPYQPTLSELRTRVRAQAITLGQLRARVTRDTQALSVADFPADLEGSVRPLLREALLDHGYPAPGRPRARRLRPKGVLLHLSTAGVYWPWAGEGNIDAGLHPLQQPSVMAHELAHAYGFGYEGTCTFWAWLAGRHAKDPALAYAFGLGYWRRIAGRLRQAEPEAYWEWRADSLDAGIRNDLQAIYDNAEQYRDIAPVVRDITYDAYLKAQGIHDGLLNYGRVVQLVEGYRKEKE